MRPELQEKRQKLKAAADDLIGDYVKEHDELDDEIRALENALAMKRAQQAMLKDTITQLSRSAEVLDRE